jgi:XTP/dITP diphosphohydrolase
MVKLLLGTNNPGKIREIKSLLSGLDLEIVIPKELGVRLEVKETGSSYKENAVIKAQAFAKAAKLWTLADDSGLEVEVLDGAPGLYSSRYAGKPGATDADRRKALLQSLAGAHRPWKAAFRCTVALCSPDLRIFIKEGTCLGEIIPEERGEGGFGYDPIFQLAEGDLTMAELSPEVKNQLSHRGQAVRSVRPLLKELINTGDIQALK